MSEQTTPDLAAPEQSDAVLARLLGRDLQTATVRSALYLAIAAAIFATVGVVLL